MSRVRLGVVDDSRANGQDGYVEAVGGYERVLQDAISVVELGNVEVPMAGVAFLSTDVISASSEWRWSAGWRAKHHT